LHQLSYSNELGHHLLGIPAGWITKDGWINLQPKASEPFPWCVEKSRFARALRGLIYDKCDDTGGEVYVNLTPLNRILFTIPIHF
jgi:hypothetical protein